MSGTPFLTLLAYGATRLGRLDSQSVESWDVGPTKRRPHLLGVFCCCYFFGEGCINRILTMSKVYWNSSPSLPLMVSFFFRILKFHDISWVRCISSQFSLQFHPLKFITISPVCFFSTPNIPHEIPSWPGRRLEWDEPLPADLQAVLASLTHLWSVPLPGSFHGVSWVENPGR